MLTIEWNNNYCDQKALHSVIACSGYFLHSSSVTGAWHMNECECGMYLKWIDSQFATFNPAMAMSRDGDLYTSVFTQI